MKKFYLRTDQPSPRPDNYRIEYERELNPAQYEAVMHDQGAVLVIAGAGTGKTRTLVYRVARLVEDGVPPESLLLLTFTRRAARQMLDRAAVLLDERCSEVRGGTFHHYCNYILHRFADRLGFPSDFTLLDTQDSIDTIQHLRAGFSEILKSRRFPGKQVLQSIYSRAVNQRFAIYDVLAHDYPVHLSDHELIEEIWNRYTVHKREIGVMDFDDLLVLTLQLFSEHQDVRDSVAASNRFVMVDEYQDTNVLQAELVAHFSSVHQNVMAVGDDAQGIYSFRGADHRNIFRFPEIFDGCRIIKLEENYRSTQPILDLANLLLEKSVSKFDKKLHTRFKNGDLPGLVKAPTERDQSRFIAQMILNLREQDQSLAEMAVLFRNGRDSYDLEWELSKKGIYFKKYGGQKFAEAAHIRDVLAHLRVCVNPDDQVAWNRVLLLIEGIGPKTAAELFQWLILNRNSELRDAGMIGRGYKQQLDALSSMLVKISALKNKPAAAVEEVIAYYEPLCKKKYEDHPKRVADLETFINLAGRFLSIGQMLQEVTLDPLDASALETLAMDADEPSLVLSTIHSAKGLEWKTVFVVQCLDGIIPSGFSIDHEEQLDEELRLLHVACTRAAERLFITYPLTRESRYGDYFSNPCRFIHGISEQILEPWILLEEPKEPSETRQISQTSCTDASP